VRRLQVFQLKEAHVSVATLKQERVNVGRMERWLSMMAGGALAAYALKRREVPGGAAALAGAALLYRGSTGHCDVYQALGINRAERGSGRIADVGSDTRQQLRGPRGIHVEAAVTVMKPISEVYRFWRNFENLPTFMQHLESVAQREEGISHWVARGPAGMKVEWDARIINEVDNKVIGWQSLEGSMISTAGSVNFRETRPGTEVRVHLQYNPPGGKIRRLRRADAWRRPERPGAGDLGRFKQYLEAAGGQPSRV
jgi:uncharacterized membrane protein